MKRKVEQLEKRISDKYSFYTIIGKSKGLERVIDLAKKVARAERCTAAFRKKKLKNEKYIFNVKIYRIVSNFIRSTLSFDNLWNCTICS